MHKSVKYILGGAWLLFVIFFYYKNHPYYLNESKDFLKFEGLAKYWQIWLAPLVIYCAFIFINWFSGKRSYVIKFSFLRILTFLAVFLFFVGNVAFWVQKPMMYIGENAVMSQTGEVTFNPTTDQITDSHIYFIKGFTVSNENDFYNRVPESFRQYLKKPSFIDIEKGQLFTYIKVYGLSILFLIFAWNLGNLLLKKIHKEEDLETHLYDLLLGLGTSASILLVFAFFGQFDPIKIIPLFILISAITYKNLFRLLKKLWNWSERYEFNNLNALVPVLLVFTIFLSINLFDNLSPVPRGWDGLNRYILTARDIAVSGKSIEIGAMYLWEMLLAFAYSIDAKMALFWTDLPGLINFALIYLLVRKYTSRTSSALILTALIAMPAMGFYLSEENKIDLAHWMFGTGTILAFLNYKNNHKYIYLAGLFAGFAFTIKFTSIFVVLALLCGFAFMEAGLLAFFAAFALSIAVLAFQGSFNLGTEFLSSEKFNQITVLVGIAISALLLLTSSFKKQIKVINLKRLAFLLIFILIPIIPWLAKNAIETESLSPLRVIYGKNDIVVLDFERDPTKPCEAATAYFEEYDRYLGYDSNIIKRLVAIPWHLTMNDTGAKGSYVDIGFFFLGFALFGILFLRGYKKNLPLLLFAFSLIFFWLIKAYGVFWYGFTIFSFLAIYMAKTFEKMSEDRTGKIIILIALSLWFTSALSAKLNFFGSPPLMLSTAGTMTYDDARENFFPYANELETYLKENPGLVYKVGTPLGFFIPNLYQRSYDDQLLDNFYCTYETKNQNYAELSRVFLKNGIKYILYDSYTNTVGLDPKGTLAKKVQLLEDYLRNYTNLIIYDDIRGYHLFQIPEQFAPVVEQAM